MTISLQATRAPVSTVQTMGRELDRTVAELKDNNACWIALSALGFSDEEIARDLEEARLRARRHREMTADRLYAAMWDQADVE